MEDSNNNFIIYQLLKLFPPILLIALLFWKRHALVNAMQALPKLIICALLWAAFALIVAVPLCLVSHNDYSLLSAAPFAAILGAIYCACFWVLNRCNKASASLLQRGLVGACLGIALSLLLMMLFAYNGTDGSFDFSHDRQSKGLFMFFCMIAAAVIIPSTIVLGLLTPRQLLLTQEKGTL
jgi:hypothetical protein